MNGSSSVAAALAALPASGDGPRVILQPTAVFLVSRRGEVWRVYDSETAADADRQMPSATSDSRHRLFVALARAAEVRVHTFADRAPRGIDSATLSAQLDASASVITS